MHSDIFTKLRIWDVFKNAGLWLICPHKVLHQIRENERLQQEPMFPTSLVAVTPRSVKWKLESNKWACREELLSSPAGQDFSDVRAALRVAVMPQTRLHRSQEDSSHALDNFLDKTSRQQVEGVWDGAWTAAQIRDKVEHRQRREAEAEFKKFVGQELAYIKQLCSLELKRPILRGRAAQKAKQDYEAARQKEKEIPDFVVIEGLYYLIGSPDILVEDPILEACLHLADRWWSCECDEDRLQAIRCLPSTLLEIPEVSQWLEEHQNLLITNPIPVAHAYTDEQEGRQLMSDNGTLHLPSSGLDYIPLELVEGYSEQQFERIMQPCAMGEADNKEDDVEILLNDSDVLAYDERQMEQGQCNEVQSISNTRRRLFDSAASALTEGTIELFGRSLVVPASRVRIPMYDDGGIEDF
ncbi:hypothetical protein GGS21DRAFT_493196 [Xylaria nigripes]|nr:hypothetical protein GGS21DRAFT_493196 [Xylaria nigripes]